ncbi:Uncharacterised protein [Klebsiella pneumoniae]|nr:Uncharacterised protein [Klebsiella pneumoniae]
MVAPNSPNERAKASTVPTIIPGRVNGNVMVKNTRQRLAPRVLAACSSLTSTPSSARRMARTISGKDITAAASTAPRQLKAKLMPNQSYSQLPINPRRPMATSSRYPTTTGGSTSGRWRILSSSALPGKVRRTSSQEKKMPKGRLKATAREETFRLSSTACHSGSLRNISGW